jgi:hypothetical protein
MGARMGNVWAKWISNFAAAYDKFIVEHPATEATTTALGHVKQSAAVTDASASSVSVTSANASTVTGTATELAFGFASAAEFNAAITAINTHTTLANELKTDVNQLVTDANAIKTQLNDLLAKMRTAGLLDT